MVIFSSQLRVFDRNPPRMNEILLRSSVTGTKDIDQTAIDALRTLAMDAVQKAKSGHPGTVCTRPLP